MRSVRRSLFLAGLCTALLYMAFAAPAEAACCGISPTSGPPGTRVRVEEELFAPNEVVPVLWSVGSDFSPSGGTQIGTGHANAQGQLDVTVTVPNDAVPGDWLIKTFGPSGSDGNNLYGFTVTPPQQPPQPLPPDTTPPVFSNVPPGASRPPEDATGAVVTYNLPTAKDDRDGDVPVTCIPSSGAKFSLGTTTVACTAKDHAGNVGTASFAVTIIMFGVIKGPDPVAPGPDGTACINAIQKAVVKQAVGLLVPGSGFLFDVVRVGGQGTAQLQVVIRDFMTGAELKRLLWDEIVLGAEELGFGYVPKCWDFLSDLGIVSLIQRSLNDWANQQFGRQTTTATEGALERAFNAGRTRPVTVRMAANQPGTSTMSVLSAPAATAAAATNRSRVLLRGQTRFERPGRKLVRLRMTTTGKRMFRHARRLRVRIVVSFKPRAGGRRRVIAGRTVTLKRRGKR